MSKRPITFPSTNIIINWSFYKQKLEICGDKNDLNIVLEFYDVFSNYGEWGENFIKPIIWMKLENETEIYKSKTYIGIEEIKKFLNNNNLFKITIYYENFISSSPLSEEYINSNSYWIDAIGGLYYIVDLFLYIEEGENLYENETYNYDKTFYKIKDYKNENLELFAIETAKTAKELINYYQGNNFKK